MVKYKYDKKVRIKRYKIIPNSWNREGEMDKYMGQIVTMKNKEIRIKEDNGRWRWGEKDFEEMEGIFKEIDDELFKL